MKVIFFMHLIARGANFFILVFHEIMMQKESDKPFYSVKLIFEENWEDYLKSHNVREIERIEVEKMLSCKDGSRGGFWYYCKTCDEYRFVPFGCNSRLCSCCGKRYTNQWSSMLADRLIKGIFHRHLVFGIPEMLWKYFQEDRKLYKILMDTAYKTIKKTFSKINHQNVVPRVIEVYHPFWRDIKHQPHVHMIFTEGGFTKDGRFVPSEYYT